MRRAETILSRTRSDETGRELLEQTLRLLAPSNRFDLELQRFDLSLANRRASPTRRVGSRRAIRALAWA